MDALSDSGRSVGKPGNKNGIILLVLASALALLTLVCMQYLERFYVLEAQLLVDPEFSAGSSHWDEKGRGCLLYTSPSPRDATLSRMPSSA